jgi:hypothetical protein
LTIEEDIREPKGTEEEPNPKADIKFSITVAEKEISEGKETAEKTYLVKSFLPPLTL